MPLPNFIIIGAMKSGTSTLHSNLQLHPEIGMSKLKEPHYFDKFYHKPLSFYADQFSSGKRINGESTPAYSWNHIFPEVPERIHKAIPDVKLIYVLRDPVDRIISHLHHDLYRGRFRLSQVDNVVLTDPKYVETSKYFSQVNCYLKYFDLENILFLETLALKNDMNKALNEICTFLEVDNFDFSHQVKARNQSSRKYIIQYYDTVHKILPRRATKLYHMIFYVANQKIARPVLKKETLLQLKSRLMPDIEKLKKISGKSFAGWRTYNLIDLREEQVENQYMKSLVDIVHEIDNSNK